ncbi:MAG: alpha/beta hydrolase family protein [bacterium]
MFRIILFISLLALTGCVEATLSWADLTPKNKTAQPVLFSEGLAPRPAQWEADFVPQIKTALQEHIYGFFPKDIPARLVSRRLIADDLFDGAARLEELVVEVTIQFDQTRAHMAQYHLLLLLPTKGSAHSLIITETFCGNDSTIPVPGVTGGIGMNCRGGGVQTGMMNYVFGRYIATPPLQMIIDHGVGLATLYPGEVIPDRAEEGLEKLQFYAAGVPQSKERWGAIAAWAWLFSKSLDVLQSDDRIDPNRIVTYGHSRYGKSALLAAAFDKRFAASIAHQSGTGGASLSKDKAGETVTKITNSYPHWFAQRYKDYAGHEKDMPLDQHFLLSLMAPRPIFLGNARRDVWSDPNGAFRAAMGANPAYHLYERDGLTARKLNQYDVTADIVYYLRPGTHGVTEEDWPAFLEFMDAHFPQGE